MRFWTYEIVSVVVEFNEMEKASEEASLVE